MAFAYNFFHRAMGDATLPNCIKIIHYRFLLKTLSLITIWIQNTFRWSREFCKKNNILLLIGLNCWTGSSCTKNCLTSLSATFHTPMYFVYFFITIWLLQGTGYLLYKQSQDISHFFTFHHVSCICVLLYGILAIILNVLLNLNGFQSFTKSVCV